MLSNDEFVGLLRKHYHGNGCNKRFAKHIEIRPETVSRYCNESRPKIVDLYILALDHIDELNQQIINLNQLPEYLRRDRK